MDMFWIACIALLITRVGFTVKDWWAARLERARKAKRDDEIDAYVERVQTEFRFACAKQVHEAEEEA